MTQLSVVSCQLSGNRRTVGTDAVGGASGAQGIPAGAKQDAEKAMKIAGDICIYTNDRITIEELKA